jgi:hypothetical protein
MMATKLKKRTGFAYKIFICRFLYCFFQFIRKRLLSAPTILPTTANRHRAAFDHAWPYLHVAHVVPTFRPTFSGDVKPAGTVCSVSLTIWLVSSPDPL